MIVDKIQFVADQLKAIAPDGDWMQGGIDRAREMGAIFVRAGVTDLWALKLIPVIVKHQRTADYVNEAGEPFVMTGQTEAGPTYAHAPAHSWIEEENSYAFDYYGKRIGYLGTQDRAENAPSFERVPMGYIVGWSSAGKGHINYIVFPNQQLKRLQILPKWESSSDADAIRSAVVTAISFFAFTALPLAGISVGTAIGNAVLPATLTAAYPAAASIVGNVALSTALNGGNVGAAVKSAVGGLVGANVGDFASGVTGFETVGALADAATRAAIAGNSIEDALKTAALSQGMQTMIGFDWSSFGGGDAGGQFDVFTPTGGFQFDDVGGLTYTPGAIDYSFTGGGFGFDPQTMPSFDFDMGGGLTMGEPPTLAEFDFGTNPFLPDIDMTADGLNPTFNPAGFDTFNPSGNQFLTQTPTGPQAPPTSPPPNSTVFDAQTIIKSLTSAALAVISVIKAYQSLDTPKVQQTARRVNPDGSVSVIGDNGLIQTRTPDGRIVSTVPPVGIPQASISGNYIVNNGDGTYTVVSPTGQSQTIRYASQTGAGGGGNLGILLMVGAAALLFG